MLGVTSSALLERCRARRDDPDRTVTFPVPMPFSGKECTDISKLWLSMSTYVAFVWSYQKKKFQISAFYLGCLLHWDSDKASLFHLHSAEEKNIVVRNTSPTNYLIFIWFDKISYSATSKSDSSFRNFQILIIWETSLFKINSDFSKFLSASVSLIKNQILASVDD